jgi:hypothetical protein
MVPFILRIHDLYFVELYSNCKVTPIQAKLYAANHFRKNAGIVNVGEVDSLVQMGYETLIEFEWHYAPQAYIFKYIAPESAHRDQARNLYNNRFDKKEHKATGFLTSFYNAKKTHVL